ncbi:hypothetical protein [Streptomyces sp. NPDC001404]|uniref:hypothetical protein n=1 Tax=Streptomyces sp. NPDC001404 TaxID=3364571 RepID=UPI0036A014C4
MSKDMVVGLVIGIVTTGCFAIQLHYALTRIRPRRAAAQLKQRIADATARTRRIWTEEDPDLDEYPYSEDLYPEEFDDGRIADEAALGIDELAAYLQKEAGQ